MLGADMKWTEWLWGAVRRSVVFALILVVVATYYVRMLRGYSAPLIVPDEFGYTVIAAYLAGHDWSNVAQGLPWYSYGYSLLLAPVYELVRPSGWYHSAQFLNVLLVMTAGVFANVLLRQYIARKSHRYLAVVAVMLYPSLVFYIHFTWSESLIVVLPWLVAIQALRMGRAGAGYLDAAAYGVVLGCCYYVHSRLIVICLAGLMVLGYQVWIGKRRLLAGVSTMAFAAAMFFGALLKNYFIDHVYHGEVGGTQDSLVKMVLELTHRFQDPSVLFTMLSAAAGQLAYLVVATLGLVVPGFISMAAKARQSHLRGRTDEASALLFLLLTLLGSYALIAITMGSSPNYPHHVFYGRYTDPIVLPALAFGLIYCMEHRRAVFKMALISLAVVFLTVPLAMHLVTKLPQVIYWVLLAGLFPYRTAAWQLNAHHILLCFSLITIALALLFRSTPRLAGAVVCLALLLAGLDLTRVHQAASSEHAFSWRARLDQPTRRYQGKIIFDASDGDPAYLRTQARMINPEAKVFIATASGSGIEHREIEDHLLIKRDSKGMQHLFCDVDDSVGGTRPTECRNIEADSLKVAAGFTLGDARKKLEFRHAWMGARAYYFVSTFPYLRTLWPSLGAHRATLRYTTHATFPTVVTIKAFLTRPGETTWLGEQSTKLPVQAGDATGLIKVPATVRAYDGNPLPPGKYSLHVLVAYPDGNDWSTIATMPMSIR
jgi:hypothetical protein